MVRAMNKTPPLEATVGQFWDEKILPTLTEYIAIPNKSPAFDSDWEKSGHMDRALDLAKSWLDQNHIPGSTVTIDKIPGRTPVILVDVPGQGDQNILMYGHLDKQPEMEGWFEGYGPWKPVLKDDKLYGRGGADDGYAIFASVCALKALKEQQLPHPRVLILIEFSEESGSPDLPAYMEKFASLIGSPDLVICLDSGAGNYNQFWATTNLRGMIACTLKVEVLTEGIHSGVASGAVPSSFRIINQILRRIEDTETGEIIPDEFKVKIPEKRILQAKETAENLGELLTNNFPMVEGMSPHECRCHRAYSQSNLASGSFLSCCGWDALL